MTFHKDTSQNNETLLFISSFNSLSDRRTIKSGEIPAALSKVTECCVGLVYNSVLGPINGTKVTCINMTFSLPNSFRI